MSQNAARSLIGWEPINIILILAAKFITTHKRIILTVIMCYAPTNEAEEDEKEQTMISFKTSLTREQKERSF